MEEKNKQTQKQKKDLGYQVRPIALLPNTPRSSMMGLNGTAAAGYCSLKAHAFVRSWRTMATREAHDEREAGEMTREREGARARGAREREATRTIARARKNGGRARVHVSVVVVTSMASVCCMLTSLVARHK